MIVQRSLEDKVRKWSQDEMAGIRKSLEVLTKSVGDLSKDHLRKTNNIDAPIQTHLIRQLDGNRLRVL
ncbi:hypothetical protein CVS40_12643 [Lucilia cuprina]|nr:hypothetical protein CVS40_12643 [Lucilia cuprina]